MARTNTTRFFRRTAALLALALSLGSNFTSGIAAAAATTQPTECESWAQGPARVGFCASTYSAAQASGSVTLTVVRSGADTSAASVEYATSNGSAIAGVNYTAKSGLLKWAEHDMTSRTITVPVNSSTPFWGTKVFQLALTDPSSGTFVWHPGTVSVSISGSASQVEGSLHLTEGAYTVSQSAGHLTVTVNRTGGSSGAIAVAYATANGTAVAGTDYTASKGVLKWASGDATSKYFYVPISNTAPFDSTKTFTVALFTADSGASIGTPNSATVDIVGDKAAAVGSFEVGAASYTVAETSGKATLTVKRVGGSSGSASVSYAARSGTAVSGTDFTATAGTLTWASGDATAKSIAIPIMDKTAFTGSKSFSVVLSAPSAGAAIASPGSATVVITGAGSTAVGSLELSSATEAVAQSAGTVKVTVDRVGGSSGAVTVAYATANGSAVTGTDYTAAKGTLSWAAGDASAKTFNVAISNATPFSGSKSFSVALSGGTGGASVGSPSTATVSISGDAAAAAGSLQLSSSSESVAQSSGSARITVNRTGGSSSAVSVAYATANGSAAAGSVYTAVNGTLTWASGDAASKTITVPVSNAEPFSGSKNFTMALSDPAGGATLSTPNTATVSVTGSEVTAASASTLWVYYNGVFNWGGDWSFQATPNYKDTAGDPIEGSYDIAVSGSANGGWQPYVSGSCQSNIADCFVTTPYKYLVMSLKPTVSGQGWDVMFHSAGDTDDGATLSVLPYGPTPVAGQWGTYKIPLSAFGLTDATVLKFFIQGAYNGAGLWYADNVGFSVD